MKRLNYQMIMRQALLEKEATIGFEGQLAIYEKHRWAGFQKPSQGQFRSYCESTEMTSSRASNLVDSPKGSIILGLAASRAC
jgi:hypothetical protein